MSFFHRELTPRSWNKYIIAYSGAVVGGITYGMTRSWGIAILWDLLCILSMISILKLVRAI